MFTMCLGKNGGILGIGGYNTDKHLEAIKWFPMVQSSSMNYKFSLSGVAINKHPISGSSDFEVAFIDSGTTFTYFPH
jgi:hypothetical protein